MAECQVWNGRSNRWVLLDDEKKGGIKKMKREKFEGVPVKGKGPAEDSPPEQSDGSSKTEPNETTVVAEDTEDLPPAPPAAEENESEGGWLAGWGW